MRAIRLSVLSTTACLCAGSTAASIPTIDAAELTQHARTSSSTVQLVPITTRRKDANQGVHCAVTTGKKDSVADPAVQPQAGAGSGMIQTYAPDMPAAPVAGSQGAALNSQTLFKSTGDVAAGLEASHTTLAAALSSFQAASRQVGTESTVTAALDMNSAARLQNGLAWNSVIGSANFWVQALNALNLAATSDASSAAIGMRTSVTTAPTTVVPVCPVGFGGTGTVADPCRASSCPSTASSAAGCVAGSLDEGAGAVLSIIAPASVLATLQSSAR